MEATPIKSLKIIRKKHRIKMNVLNRKMLFDGNGQNFFYGTLHGDSC